MLTWLFSDPLPPGTPAPDFTLTDEAGRTVTLSKLKGKNVILVFYPGDDTPGCTKQLCGIRDHWEEALQRDTRVFGVNPQEAASHARFREKYKFPFPLLVDKGRVVAKAYQAHGLIVKRTVYLVGPDGVIRFARRGMPTLSEVLATAG